MKLKRIDIENFGIFSKRTLEFDDTGLQLIYGRNEAGKSTLLQLVRETLFGFRIQQHPYAFHSHVGKMAVNAHIELADGTELEFRRQKAIAKNQVAGRYCATGTLFDAADLTRLLGNAGPELYQHVFAVSLSELAAGQDSLRNANLDDALYGSALGGLVNLQAVRDQLRKEAEELFTPTARKRVIHDALSAIRKLKSELRDATVKPRDFEQQQTRVSQLRDEVSTLRTHRDVLQRERAHGDRLAQALTPWLEVNHAEQQRNLVVVPQSFPADGLELYRRLREKLDTLLEQQQETDREIQTTTLERDRLNPNPVLEPHAAEIIALSQHISEISKVRTDLPLRLSETDAHSRTMLSTIRELDPQWDASVLDRFATSLIQREALRRLRDDRQEIRELEHQWQSRHQSLLHEIEQLELDLVTAHVEPIAPDIIELVEQGASFQADVREQQRLHVERDERDHELAACIERLNQPFDKPVDCAKMAPVPLAATLSEFQQRFESARDNIRQLETERRHQQGSLQQKQHELAEVTAQQSVPSQEDLAGQRRLRDAGWELIRGKFIDQRKITTRQISNWIGDEQGPLDTVYGLRVQQADRTADARQQNAELVARTEQLQREINRIGDNLAASELQLQTASRTLDELQTEWESCWAQWPFTPASPAAMIEWTRTFDDFRELKRQQTRESAELATVNDRITQFHQRLDSLSGCDGAVDLRLAQLREQISTAGKIAAVAEDKQHRFDRLKQDIEKTNEQLLGIDRRRADWQSQCVSALRGIGFPADWDINVATRVLDGLSAARTEYDQAAALRQRIADMNATLEHFESGVTALSRSVKQSQGGLSAELYIQQLQSELEANRRIQQQHTHLSATLTRSQRQQETLNGQIAAVKQQLEDLLAQAEVNSDVEFRQVADNVAHRTELDHAMRTARQQIAVIRGTEDAAVFEEELKGIDTDSLAERQRHLAEQLTSIEAEFEAAQRKLTLEDNHLAKIEDAQHALEKRDELESKRSALSGAVERYAPLVLAQVLLRRAIERFEREHQPAMMRDTAELLSRMTDERYVGLQPRLDEQGTLEVIDADGNRRTPAELSTGTREQLYLALRLAYIRHYCRDSEPLPVVMDDLLVNFDRERARQTLRVLLELSESMQIIFLTCHQHIVELITTERPTCAPIELSSTTVSSWETPRKVRPKAR